MIKGILGGLVGGLLGAAVWAALAYFIKIHHTGVAIGVGGLVGICAGKAAGKDTGMRVGLVAAVIALLAILTGKYAAVRLTVENKFVTPASQVAITDEMLTMILADGLASDREAAGEKLAWPPGQSLTTVDKTPQDYPPDVWAAATDQWNGLPSSARETLRENARQELGAIVGAMGKDAVWEKFKKSLGAFDIFLIALASLAALGVAANGWP